MSKVKKIMSRVESQREKDKEKEKKAEYVKSFGSYPQPDVVMILPDGTRKVVSADEYKKKGKELWKSTTQTTEVAQ